MPVPDTEQLIKELFRENLAREVSRPEVQSAKADFLASFYAPAGVPAFSPFQLGFLIPVVLLSVFFLAAHFYQVRQSQEEGPSLPIYRTFGEVLLKAKTERAQVRAIIRERRDAQRQADLQAAQRRLLDDPVLNHMKPRVIVKRLSSQTGSTLVYQRAYRKTPVTIVWVFPTAGGQG